MATSKLEIQIDATGNAVSEIGKVGGALEDLGGKADKLVAGEQMAALREVGAATVDVFGALASTGGEWIDMAAEAELIGAKLDAQLEAMGDTAKMTRPQLDDLADELSKVTMFEDEAVLSAEAILLRFQNINQDAFPDAIRLSADLATMLGTDITSAAQSLGMALEDPVGALGRLRRAGIIFSAEQEEMIKGMVEAGDVAGAQALIMSTLEQKIGGAATAAGTTFAGQMVIAQTAADNMKESIGQSFIDAFSKLPEPIKNAALTVMGFGDEVGSIAGPVIALIGTLAQLKAVGGISALFSGLSASLTATATAAWATIAPVLAAAAPFLLLAAAVGLLIVVIKKFGAEAWNTVSMIGQIVGAIFQQAGRIGSEFVRGIWEGIKSGWEWLKTSVANLATSLIDAAKRALGIHSPSALFAEQVGKPSAEGIAQGFKKAAPAMTSSIGGALAPVPGQSVRGMGLAGGGGGGGVTVVYSPTFSAASMKEFETLLVPLIDRQITLNQRRRVEAR